VPTDTRAGDRALGAAALLLDALDVAAYPPPPWLSRIAPKLAEIEDDLG